MLVQLKNPEQRLTSSVRPIRCSQYVFALLQEGTAFFGQAGYVSKNITVDTISLFVMFVSVCVFLGVGVVLPSGSTQYTHLPLINS